MSFATVRGSHSVIEEHDGDENLCDSCSSKLEILAVCALGFFVRFLGRRVISLTLVLAPVVLHCAGVAFQNFP